MTPHRAAQENRERLELLEAGMSRDEVLETMGTGNLEVGSPLGTVRNPHQDIACVRAGHRLEVLYYFTAWRDNFAPPEDGEGHMTPIVLLDGELIGWGSSFWKECSARWGGM